MCEILLGDRVQHPLQEGLLLGVRARCEAEAGPRLRKEEGEGLRTEGKRRLLQGEGVW